ncbi:hypothetical protein D3C79_1082350 [compost metagenome]
MQPCSGLGALCLQLDLAQASLDQLLTGGDDAEQIALAGAVAGQAELHLLPGQRHEAVAVAMQCPL